MSRKSFKIKANFDYIIDTTLDSFEKAFAILNEFKDCDSEEISAKVENIQEYISGCCQAILSEVDTVHVKPASEWLLGQPSGQEISVDDKELVEEAEEEVERLFKSENDGLMKLQQENARIKQLEAKVME